MPTIASQEDELLQTSYARFLQLSRDVYALRSVAKLLSWDQQTYLPPKGVESRSEQSAVLARVIHRRIVSEELHATLEELEASCELESLGPEAVANVRELRREHERERNVPDSLVDAIERTAGMAHQAWVEAKRQDAFASFEPWLAKLLHLKKEWTQAVGYQDEPYDALLETYEPGIITRDVVRLFDALRPELVNLLHRIADAPRKPDTSILRRPFEEDHLRQFIVQVTRDVGFDFERGRMDAAVHAFCEGITMTDVRIATSFNPSNPIDSLFAVIHEVGHGLYHQGLLPEHRGTPMGVSVSLGVHESQARWWENFIARSRPFWNYYFPQLQRHVPTTLGDITPDQFTFAINNVSPSLIRVEADEVTYNLHVLLRFELERALFNDDLATGDLPGAWADKLHDYLAIRPATNAEGVLQDVHWSLGMFGYFPTYALGNLYAAQFDRTMQEELPHLSTEIRHGRFHEALEWLRSRIHRRGSLYPPAELIQRATGETVRAGCLVEYLQRKFGELYGL